jgi:hypothetical protein
MNYDPEHDEAPSYEGEVTDERTRLRPRTWIALGALGIGVGSVLTENYLFAVGLIVAYVLWMFVRDWLRRRAQRRDWRNGGGTIERMKGVNL